MESEKQNILRITRILALAVSAALFAGIAANSMTKPLAHDEQMYCAAGALIAKGDTIYKDFSYVSQMPYHPLLYALVYKLTGTTWYLHIGRMISALCNILTALCIFGIYRRVFKEFSLSATLFGLAAVVLYLFNPVVDYSNGHAWNHDVVTFLVVWSVWLFIGTDFSNKSKYRRIALIGALLTLACCMRVTTVLALALFTAVLFFWPGETLKERFKMLLAFALASAAVLIWPIRLIIQAPTAFYLNMFYIPMLNGEFLRQIGMSFGKFQLTTVLLSRPGYLLLLIITVYLYVSLLLKRHKLQFPHVSNFILTGGLAVAFFIIAYIPPTIWMQYLAPPAVFLIISLAYPLYYLRKAAAQADESQNIKFAFRAAGVCIVLAVLFYPAFLLRIPALAKSETWPAVKMHRTAVDIAENTPSPKRALTLAPLLALEGGCDIYREFSAGVFAYRVAGLITDNQRQIANIVGPQQLDKLLADAAPSAVILGAEPQFLEEPLFQTAVKNNWRKKIYEDGITAYFRE